MIYEERNACVADAFNPRSILAINYQCDGDLNLLTTIPGTSIFGYTVRIRTWLGGGCYGDFQHAMHQAMLEYIDNIPEKSLFHLMGYKVPQSGTVLRLYNDDVVLDADDSANGQLNIIISSRPIRRIGVQTFSAVENNETTGPIVWLDRTNVGTKRFNKLWHEAKRLKNGESRYINRRYFVNDELGIKTVKKQQKGFQAC